ncbi:hypothetical protein CPC08DRAFT_616748, partial [Agrocybe pediades]
EKLMKAAIEMHKAEMKKPKKECLSLQKICTAISQEHYQATGNIVKLSHSTLAHHSAGGMSREQASAARSWLLDSEVELVIEIITDYAERDFPIDHKRLKEVVDSICSARLGDKFPKRGVDQNWMHHFSVRH